MKQTCGSCAFKAPDNQHCRVFGHPINVDVDFCSKHNPNPNICTICGNPIVTGDIIVQSDDKIAIVCRQCNEMIGTCATCEIAQYCAFENDPSPIPQFVTKKIRQGNSVSVIRVPNIERIDRTCKNGCLCFDPENGCLRQSIHCCSKYKENFYAEV